MYTKKFKNFMEGIRELCEISYSIEDSLSASHYDPVRTLNRGAIEWGLEKNIIDGMKYQKNCPDNCPKGKIHDGFVTYTTTSGIEYGWNENKEYFKFYIEFRKGSIYENAKKLGWTEQNYFFVSGPASQHRLKQYQEQYQENLKKEEKLEILKKVSTKDFKKPLGLDKLNSFKTYKESYRIKNGKEYHKLLDMEEMEFPCFVESKEIYGSEITTRLYLVFKPVETIYFYRDSSVILISQKISDDPYDYGFSKEEFIEAINKSLIFATEFQDYDQKKKNSVEIIFNNDLSLKFWNNQYGGGVKVIYNDGTICTTTNAKMTDTLYDHLPEECDYISI